MDIHPRKRQAGSCHTKPARSGYARAGAGGAREEVSAKSDCGCSPAGVLASGTAIDARSGSRIHDGSATAWSSAETPGRNAARATAAMQRKTMDRRGLGTAGVAILLQ